MKVRIPLLMLGPYLRPFLIACIVITGAVAIGLFISGYLARSPRRQDEFIESSLHVFVLSLFFVAVFVGLWLLGMP